MGIINKIKAHLASSSEKSKKSSTIDVEAESKKLQDQAKEVEEEKTKQSIRKAADTILKARESMTNGKGMESRGEKERQVKNIVKQAFEKYEPDQEMIQNYISPRVLSVCSGDRILAEKLVDEAIGEIFLERMKTKYPGQI